MNTSNTVQTTSSAREYLDQVMRFVSDDLSRIAHQDLKVEMISFEETLGPADTKDKDGTWIRLAAAKAGEQAFFLGDRDANQLLQLLNGGSTGQDAGQPLDPSRAMEAFFSQIAAKISLAEWLGLDAKLEVFGREGPPWEGLVWATYRFSSLESPLLVLQAVLSSNFATTLQSGQRTETFEKREPSSINSSPDCTASGFVIDTHLELLMDVELEVVLRFGQREMLLRDVLSLTAGTVLELDQQVQDPVELLVGNKVIAWGDVVTVDGNYGLRITGLASHKERLESLRR